MPAAAPLKPRKQPRQARSRATVEVILDATARILVSHGYAAASTNRIAEVAGISVGSLYQYFPSKEALVTALRRRHAEQMRAMLLDMAASAAGAPLPVAARTLIHAVMAAHMIDPQLHRVLDEEVPRPDLADGRDDIEASMRQVVKGLLVAHRASLLPLDVDLASLMLVRLVDALIHTAVIVRPADARPDAIEQEIVAIVLRYLTGQASEPGS